ncbi:MAG: STAS domain-containing protein [Prevotella sp.]|nr:STAS domain-containing protein [Prevotella sp.]
MLKITITEQGERQIVKLSGELDNTASRDAVKDLTPVMEQDKFDVEIDCSELKYISSSGLRLLLNIYKHQCTIGRRRILSHMDDYIKKVFNMGGFLTIYETEE